MTVLPSPEAMIVICTVVLIAYTAHVLGKAFASSEQFEAMLKARERIMGLQAENAKLRELTKDYEALTATICNERNSCDGCPFDDPERIVCERMRIQTCLSELGVEVDG